jgi:hypothetical protein
MYETISKKMNGIRQGEDISLQPEKEKKDGINGPEDINVDEPLTAGTRPKKKILIHLLSKDIHLTARLLNTVPGNTCPKCGECFRGFKRDHKGGLSTKCCKYKTFNQVR